MQVNSARVQVFKASLFSFIILRSVLSYGNPFGHPVEKIWSRLQESARKEIEVLPFANQGQKLQFTSQIHLELYQQGYQDFESTVRNTIISIVDKPMINVKIKPNQNAQQNALDVFFTLNNIPICEHQVHAHQQIDGSIALLGYAPSIKGEVRQVSQQWPLLSAAFAQAQNFHQQQDFYSPKLKFIRAQKCYFIDDGLPQPTWLIIAADHSLSFRYWADDSKIYKFERLYFDVTKAKVQAYEVNPLSQLVEFSINVVGDQTMTSPFFLTNTESDRSMGVPRAVSAEHLFIYQPSEPEFAEASVFDHAHQSLGYFQQLGYTWEGENPLELNINLEINGTKNNALYKPASGSQNGMAEILIGDGDGIILQNLTTDSDVVSHEFAHHVIFRKLKSVSGESLVLHEGLADYFTFAKTKDWCLGESICVEDAEQGCVIQGLCLRTAENNLNFLDKTFPTLGAHHKGQIISGLLKDLSETIPAEDLVQIVYNSIDLFVVNSGYKHFLSSLMLADQNFSAGKYLCDIYQAAVARGFEQLLTGVDCRDINTVNQPQSDHVPVTTTENTGSSKKGPFGCGAIGAQKENTNLHLWLIFFLPLFWCLRSSVE